MFDKNSKIRRYYFDLSATNPVHIVANYHSDPSESYFDMHYELELGVVVKGEMKREYLNHEKIIGPGETWLCSIWEPHGFKIEKCPCEVVVFFADPTQLNYANPFSFDLLRLFMISPEKRPDIEQKQAMIELALKAKEKLLDNQGMGLYGCQPLAQIFG